MRNRFSIKATISIIVFFSILSVFFTLLFLVLKNSNDIVAISERENFNRLTQIVKWESEDEIEFAGISLRRIASDDTAAELLAARNKTGLFDYVSSDYEFIRDRVIRFHFHLPDGMSFLRVHNPALSGDDLTEIRPMVVQMMDEQREIRGIEKGREGLSQRAMMPIFHGGKYVGSVEYGMDFGYSFLNRIKERYDGSYFLYELDEDGFYTLLASTGDVPECSITNTDMQTIVSGEAIWSKKCKGLRNVGLIPVFDFSGDVAGFIKVEVSRDLIVEELSLLVRRFIIISIIIAILVTAVVFFSLIHLFFKPLRRVVAQTTTISDQITKGNLYFRGNIDEAAVDFQGIIRAINTIIATLRERENILKAIIDGFPGIIYYLDNDYNVLWANERAKKVGGEAIIGSNLAAGPVPHGFFENEYELLAATVRDGTMKSSSACYYRGGAGEVREECWEHTAIPICNERGEVKNILRIATDITDKEEAKMNLRKLNETLERRVAEEVHKRKEQEDKAYNQSRLASIGELAAGIAHELNQPLNSLAFSVENVYTRFLDKTIDDEYFKKKMKAISGDISRTRRIIEHVRTFARESTDEYNMRFSANQCIGNALSMVGVQFATHGIDIARDLEDDLPNICGNPFQYEQVVLNLLSNAKDAIEERTQKETYMNNEDPGPRRITVKTRSLRESVILEVSDTGVGIPEAVKDRIFDPFFTTKDPGTGTGLGLSISYGIVKKMGGTIEIVSGNPKTTIKVFIPIRGESCRN
jgi:signal transduction histidine kinase